MKYREISLRCVWLAALVWINTVHATGPSSAKIEIVPLAVNGQGVVLCKTESHINLMGAQTLNGLEYGWLAISADGVWDEQIYERIDDDEAEQGEWLDVLMRDYEQRTDLRQPPPSLRHVMARYGFNESDNLTGRQLLQETTWNGGRLCAGPHCLGEKVPQRTLKGLVSQTDSGSLVSAHFVAAGVALFANHDYSAVDEGERGAPFSVENNFQGNDIGVDLQEVTGVVILPPSLRFAE